MVKFSLTARCGEDSIPLEVDLNYKPGKQSQRARRIAVGYLLDKLDAVSANVDASGEDQVFVSTETQTWIIGETGVIGSTRGRI